MGQYKKRALEIEAIQFTGDNVREIWANFGMAGIYGPTKKNPDWLILTTIHGDSAPCRVDDWVVPDSRPGTFYPIKPEVFDNTYDLVVPANSDYIEIGPECFAYKDELVISWKGQEFYKPCGEFVSDLDDGGQSFCVKIVDHPGLYHENSKGKQKLRAEVDGPGELANLDVAWPRVAPLGTPVSRSGVKDVWEAFITPIQESGQPPSVEARSLLAILRHVRAAMPEDDARVLNEAYRGEN